MKFSEKEITDIKLDSFENLNKLIQLSLYGREVLRKVSVKTKSVNKILQILNAGGLNHEQFNEMLLLLHERRISKGFFKFFFGGGSLDENDLKQGIIYFRGIAMLEFGNFRYAFKKLSSMNLDEITTTLKNTIKGTKEIEKEYKDRPQQILNIDLISGNDTWMTGYISGTQIMKDTKELEKIISQQLVKNSKDLDAARKLYVTLDKKSDQISKQANNNTEVYLSWDYMDIYIATSMRNSWEYSETSNFIRWVFSKPPLKDLNLRYFDPTQSVCSDRIDKGLLEALMLKRAKCAVYMVQESDTLGKDSELAVTLAQGKPVIAYVPRIKIKYYSKKIKEYPLEYFKKRLLSLEADGKFEDEKLVKILAKSVNDYDQVVENFHLELKKHRTTAGLSALKLFQKPQDDFKAKFNRFDDLCKILSIMEKDNFDHRARILIKSHPLAIQVELTTGVANGVLVVRTPQQCRDVLYNLLLNEVQFNIKQDTDSIIGKTILQESVTECTYRVVTEYQMLSNAFWNFYLDFE